MTKRCKVCKKTNKDPLKKTCSFKCYNEYLQSDDGAKDVTKALKKARRDREKKQRDQVKGLRHWLAVTQRVCNEYIRLRDKGKPCISCGSYEHNMRGSHLGGVWDAGHYKTVGAHPQLRFDPRNLNGQCRDCNGFKSGNIAGQEKGIVARFGSARLDWLNGHHEPNKYTIEGLAALRKDFRNQIKQIKQQKSNHE